MFEIGNFVVNANNGICKITDVVVMDIAGTKETYFVLVPLEEQTAEIYIPVHMAESRIRLAMTKEQALDVIKSILDIEQTWIENEKEREKIYKEAIASREPKKVIGIIKTLYVRRQERIDVKKKNTAIDERYFKLAENQIYGELAFALGEEKQNIKQIILEYIQKVNK
ncbi:MAG: CarD family transcriptional regulator [Lachnospiraceae bacterium]|nr:CarD family transcriptional regulator [Lachnospiraceae bacterium]